MKECPVCRRCFPDKINHCPSDGDLLKFTFNGDPVLDGRYQLESRLGQGGMGAVYKARHIFLKTPLAIKIILPDLVGNDPSLVTRFRQEAMAAAAIRHPNIVAVTDFGVVGGTTPFLVMEFIQGKSLNDILQEEGRLKPERALEIMAGVGAGLGAAHRQGIIHRDLKPLNIMVREDAATMTDAVKLLDFGLAKIKSGELLGSFVAAQTTGLMGSPFYMAPEQWSEEEPDRRADIYSLGVILYQMLSGEVPFRGSSIPAIMKKHLTTPPPALAAQNIGVSAEVERVVNHALEKEPDARPQTVEDFIAELRAAVEAERGATTHGGASTHGGTTGRISSETIADISPVNTMLGVSPHATTGGNLGGTIAGSGEGGHAATFQAPHATEAQIAHAQPQPDPRATLAEPAARRGAETGNDLGGNHQTPADTGRQLANQTAFMPVVAGGGATSAGLDAPGHSQPPQPHAEASRETQLLDSPAAREQQEEYERHAGSGQFGGSGQHGDAAARDRASREASARGSLGQTSNANQYNLSQEIAPQQTMAARTFETAAQQQQQFAASGGAASAGQASAASSAAAAPQKKSRAPLIAVGAVVVLALLGSIAGLAYVLMSAGKRGANSGGNVGTSVGGVKVKNTNANRGTGANANATKGGTTGGGDATTDAPARADMVELPGGTFQIGRSDLPPNPNTLAAQGHSQDYLQWLYTQWPAHAVSIQPFAIDRTEVTNAEYAQFVNATGYPPPPGIWEGNQPKPGQELWPVRNVTLEDAQRFAVWRSKRDGVTYRLPTEEEWEYAARGGDASRLYPWGADYVEGRANLSSDTPAPVRSFKDGETPQGVSDMIGNVWEWTSTEASMYKGNNLLKLPAGSEGGVVVRGGSYQSYQGGASADKPITATSRNLQPKDKRDPVIGFRLVRAGS